jgi:hypothetical protein
MLPAAIASHFSSLNLLRSDAVAVGPYAVVPVRGVFEGSVQLAVHVASAMMQGQAVIREVKPPRVDTVEVENLARRLLVIPTGTLLQGGGQNRMVVEPAVLEVGETAQVKVRCVQRGRWTPNTNTRFSGTSSAPLSIRRSSSARSVQRRSHRTPTGHEQMGTWSDVTEYLGSRSTHSNTEDLFDGLADAEAAARSMELPPSFAGAAGIAVLEDGEWRLLETTGCSSVAAVAVREAMTSTALESGTTWSTTAPPDTRPWKIGAHDKAVETKVHGGVVIDLPLAGGTAEVLVRGDTVLHVRLSAA